MDIVTDDIIKLFLAVLLGSIIGAEREYRTKSAGFRTLILVTVGSTLFTIFSVQIGAPDNADRIAANIITGIGFLGAGAIFRSDNGISGLTTATTIWMAAAIGMGVGAGEYILSGFATGVIIVVLYGFTFLEKFIDKLHQNRTYTITTAFREESLYHYEEIFKSCNLRSTRGKQSRNGNDVSGSWEIRGSQKDHERLVRILLTDKEIKSCDF